MKKVFACILAIITITLTFTTIFAEGTMKQYAIPTSDIQFELPEGWYTLKQGEPIPTGLNAKDQKVYDALNKALQKGPEAEFAAVCQNPKRVFIITKNSKADVLMNVMGKTDEDKLNALQAIYKSHSAFRNTQMYKGKNYNFVIVEAIDANGNLFKLLNATCFYNTNSFEFSLSPQEDITDDIRTEFKSMLDTVQFGKAVTTTAPIIEPKSDSPTNMILILMICACVGVVLIGIVVAVILIRKAMGY